MWTTNAQRERVLFEWNKSFIWVQSKRYSKSLIDYVFFNFNFSKYPKFDLDDPYLDDELLFVVEKLLNYFDEEEIKA